LLGGQDGRAGPAGLGSARGAGCVGAGRGPVRNHKGRPQFVDCVRMVHLRRDFQAMIDPGGAAEPSGRRLLKLSDRLFRWWDRLEAGEVDRRRFGAAMGRLRGEVEAALRHGTRCGCGTTSGSCAEILRVEESLWTFARVEGVAPTNNAAER